MRVRELRLARGWSQAQLAEISGLSVRTIQRMETGANLGLESMRVLAEVFGVDVGELQPAPAEAKPLGLVDAVVHCLRHYSDFEGVAGRAEFWWFTLAVALATAVGQAVGPWLTVLVGALVIVPWLAVAARRIRDAGESPWWLLILPAPVGGLVVVATICAMPTRGAREPLEAPST